MNTKKTLFFSTYNTLHTLPSAQLWIGNHTHILETVELFLQKLLCNNNNCATCITCLQIREKQHHAIMWLHPEKNYTIDQLDDLFTALSFQLQPNEHFFFILQKADYLTTACANKLLKSIEEPPTGYHFILLAEQIEQILPTIRSRCITHTFNNSYLLQNNNPIFECFTTKAITSDQFSRTIDTTPINERESIELLTQIIHYWLIIYQQKIQTNEISQVSALITKLQQAQLHPPMPGSCTLFWRNLYLQVHKELLSITQTPL